jgi:Spy/CpxP family protein refolding chaperone
MQTLFQSVFVLVLAALLTVPALAQPPGALPVPPPIDFVGALMTKSVQEELKLTAEQVNDVSAAVRKVREKYQDNLAKLRTLEPKEQAELLAIVDDETRKAAAEILKPEQAKRLNQIELQIQGLYALRSEEVAKDLKLTDDQKDKIKGVVAKYQKDCAALAKEFPEGISVDTKALHAYLQKVHTLAKSALADMEKVLNDDQCRKWQELTGAPFEFKE